MKIRFRQIIRSGKISMVFQRPCFGQWRGKGDNRAMRLWNLPVLRKAQHGLLWDVHLYLESLRGSEATKQTLSDEITQTLDQFKKEGLKCSYYQCDVSNEKDVFNAIGKIEKEMGKITGFIHGAGLNSLNRLKQVSVSQAYQESLPKVIGAVNICKALAAQSSQEICHPRMF